MEGAFLVGAPVGMRAEVVALGLDQVGRESRGAIGIVVCQRLGQARCGNAARRHIPGEN